MDVALTLDFLVPGADFRGSLTANDRASYDALIWADARAKPAWADIVAADAAARAAYDAAQTKPEAERLADLLRGKGVITRAEQDALKLSRG